MEAETLAGLVGLGGTVVGVGGTLLGGLIQQRHQARTTRDERAEARASEVESRGREVAEKALTELYGLRRHALTWKVGMSSDEQNQWAKTAHTMADDAELNAALIPGADALRERLQDALSVTRKSFSEDAYETEHEPYKSEFDTGHSIALLSAYMRGDEALPTPTLRERRESTAREAQRDL
ncbi:hypothetical protein ACFYXF_33085 [Streptomyces sp. NPDC002680]|uniref:hypothetical protein n=1 Tax=Streptomyces sp. NPDC002680 TaxID=3364659 RepID=UPI0036B5B8D8